MEESFLWSNDLFVWIHLKTCFFFCSSLEHVHVPCSYQSVGMLFIGSIVYSFKNDPHRGVLCSIAFLIVFIIYFRKILHPRCLWLSWQGGSKVTCCRCPQPMTRYFCGTHRTRSQQEHMDQYKRLCHWETELPSHCIRIQTYLESQLVSYLPASASEILICSSSICKEQDKRGMMVLEKEGTHLI